MVQPHSTLSSSLTLVLAIASAGCCRVPSSSSSEAPATREPAKSEPAKPASPTTPAAPAKPASPTPAATPDSNAMGPDGLPVDIPSTRSAVPTVAEWAAVPREITVRKSTPLGCETKMVREWLRVSCRGKNNLGGTPLDVKKVAGCTADTYLFSSGGITSLVTPVLRGKTCDAAFSWTMGANQLWVRWPNGAPRPTIAFQD